MLVMVRLFAILRDRLGTDGFPLELPDGADVSIARESIAARYPTAREHLAKSAFAVNQEYAGSAVVLSEGDELAVIPPVSGG